MKPKLRQWLKPLKEDERDLICRYVNLTQQFYRVAKKTGIIWKKNALRHSYISYRLAEVKNIYQVAEECGNSPDEIKRSYREIQLDDGRVITGNLAKEWFGI